MNMSRCTRKRRRSNLMHVQIPYNKNMQRSNKHDAFMSNNKLKHCMTKMQALMVWHRNIEFKVSKNILMDSRGGSHEIGRLDS